MGKGNEANSAKKEFFSGWRNSASRNDHKESVVGFSHHPDLFHVSCYRANVERVAQELLFTRMKRG